MKTVSEIRLDNLDILIEEYGTQDKVAEAAGTSSVYLSQIKNRSADAKTGKLRQMGDDMARKLEAGCNKERGWMDHSHGMHQSTHPDSARTSAILACEPTTSYIQGQKYDAWTMAAIELLQGLDNSQREAMVYRMREFKQFMGPPRNGQALSMAG